MNKASKRAKPSTMDAWLMLSVAFGLYTASQLLFTKISILGGTAISLVKTPMVPGFIETIQQTFSSAYGRAPQTFTTRAAGAAAVIKSTPQVH